MQPKADTVPAMPPVDAIRCGTTGGGDPTTLLLLPFMQSTWSSSKASLIILSILACLALGIMATDCGYGRCEAYFARGWTCPRTWQLVARLSLQLFYPPIINGASASSLEYLGTTILEVWATCRGIVPGLTATRTTLSSMGQCWHTSSQWVPWHTLHGPGAVTQ